MSASRLPVTTHKPRLGLTLLEVMLAIAILGGALAAIGEIIRIGGQASEEAREVTTAQLHCETKMAELVTGISPIMVVSRVPLETDPNWVYTVLLEPVQQDGLVAVVVTVEENVPLGERGISYSLVRWMIDPLLEFEEAAAGGSTSDASSSSTGTSSTGGAGAGGTSGSGGGR